MYTNNEKPLSMCLQMDDDDNGQGSTDGGRSDRSGGNRFSTSLDRFSFQARESGTRGPTVEIAVVVLFNVCMCVCGAIKTPATTTVSLLFSFLFYDRVSSPYFPSWLGFLSISTSLHGWSMGLGIKQNKKKGPRRNTKFTRRGPEVVGQVKKKERGK